MPTDKTISNRSPKARFYLSTDHDPGYWQIFLELTSCGKLAFLHQQLFMTPNFLKMLLTAYYCMPDTLLAYFKCTFEILSPPVQNLPSCTNIYSGHLCFKSCCWQNTIVCKRPDTLLAYLECAFEMLLQYQAHVKLKKCKFLHPILECVGVELTSNGNKPTRSKLPAFFKKILPPETWADLCILIGMFDFFKIILHPGANFRLNNPSQLFQRLLAAR